jgi:hypothetical protein
MTLDWKMWTLIGIVAVAVVAAVAWKQFGTETPITGENQANQETPITGQQNLPTAVAEPATGNIDDAVAAVLAGAADDEAVFADAAKDADLVGADSQTITNLGQSSYANEI